MSLGTATLLPLNNVAGMAATALSGYGLGLTLSAGNLWIGEVAAQRRTSALSILNLAWGLGAVSSAPLVMFAQLAQQPLTLLASIAALSGLIAVTLAAMAIQPIARNRLETRLEKDIPIKPVLPALGTFFFLYVGIETCVGGWAATLARRMATSSGELWTLAPMLFWAGLLTGRALTPVLLREMSEQALLIGGMTMGMLGTLALLLSQAFLSALICVAITGFGLASIYPILVSWMVGHYGSQARQTGSVMFVMGSLGGATLPWLVGFTSMRTNSLTTGLWIPLVGCLLMISLASFSPISASER
jgi:fucose permease